MSSIQCPSCNAIVSAYARYCKQCGAVISSAPNTGPVRHFSAPGAFNPANSGSAPAYHRLTSAEQAWGQREENAGYAPATLDPAPGEGPLRTRRPEPDTERLPSTRHIKSPRERAIRLEKLPPAENAPIVAAPEQTQHETAPQPTQRPDPRPPARPAYVLPSTQPQQRLGVQQPPSAPAPPNVTPRLHSVQLRKLQPQELLAQHSLLPIEQQVSEEEVKQATRQNLMGLPTSTQRLEVQPVYPIALMRQEPFSLPTSLRIPSLKRRTSKRLLIWEIILVILLLIGIIGGLLLIFTHAFPSQPGAPSKPALTLIGQALPGSKVTLHGKNFAPGSSVKFRLDTVPLAQTALLSNALASYSTQMQIEKPAIDNTGVIVRRDGTFDKTFTIPLQWKSGSAHSIEVDVQSKQAAISVHLNFVVSTNSSALTPQPTAARSTPTPTPRHAATPKVVPTPVPTPVQVSCISVTPQQISLKSLVGKQGITGAVTLSNCGANGTWSSSVSTDNGGNWLWLSAGHGWLAGGAAQRISLASAALDAGTYTGWITFSSGATVVSVNVSLVVTASCKRSSPRALSYTNDADLNNPISQIVTLSCCRSR